MSGTWRLDHVLECQRGILVVAPDGTAALSIEAGPTPLDAERAALLLEEWKSMAKKWPKRYRLTPPRKAAHA